VIAEDLHKRVAMSALYLVQQGVTLRKEQARFVVEAPLPKVKKGEEPIAAVGMEPLRVPIQEVEQVLVFGHIHLSTAAISTCLEGQVPVVFLSQSGRY
jgi:CRISP-associated protein Cas1